MKKLIITAILLSALTASAAGFLEKDASNQTVIQGFAPNGLFSSLLTVNSTTINGTGYLAFQVYSPVACKIRFMATSSTTGSVSQTIEASERLTFVVNKATPFFNISGATGGDLSAM